MSDENSGILNIIYTNVGEQFPKFILSQGGISDVNVPSVLSDFTKETVEFKFNADKMEGVYIDMGASNMLYWKYNGISFSCGGQLERDQLLKILGELTHE
jgi:hypothetical protein